MMSSMVAAVLLLTTTVAAVLADGQLQTTGVADDDGGKVSDAVGTSATATASTTAAVGGTFDLCGTASQCECVQADTRRAIQCENGRLRGVLPSKISVPAGYATLDFSRNAIPFLRGDTFDGTYLAASVVRLDFSSNDIGYVGDGSLEMFQSLRELVMRRNRIANLTLGAFRGLRHLETLDLGYNDIVAVDMDVLYQCNALRQLSLRYNALPLSALQDLLASASSNLEELDVHGLGLEQLPDDLFQPVPYVQRLVLSANRLQRVPGEALSRLQRLLVLDLSDNFVSDVRPIDFEGMESLEELLLDRMKHLRHVAAGSFRTLARLRVFSCSFNPRLTLVDDGAFPICDGDCSWHLEEVHLRQNGLASLSESLLPWHLIRYVDLSENPWNCDCRIAWMKRIQWDLRRVPPIACEMPWALRRRLIAEIPARSFRCDAGVDDHLLASLALLLSTVGLLTFAFCLFTCWKLSWFNVCRAGFQRRYVKLRSFRNGAVRGGNSDDVEMYHSTENAK